MSKLDTAEYDHIVRDDFENYMNGGNKTTRDEKETVAMSISELLGASVTNKDMLKGAT